MDDGELERVDRGTPEGELTSAIFPANEFCIRYLDVRTR